MHQYKRLKVTYVELIPNSISLYYTLRKKLNALEFEEEPEEMAKQDIELTEVNELTYEEAELIAEFVTKVDEHYGLGVSALQAIINGRENGLTVKQCLLQFKRRLKPKKDKK